MVDIGRLNKRITFMRYENEIDEYARDIQKLNPFRTVWAAVEPVSGKEYLEAQRTKNELNYKIYTRYFPDITTNMIIDYKDRKFKIITPINHKENNEMLQFICTETVGDKIE